MKKSFLLAVTAVMALSLLSGCGKKEETAVETAPAGGTETAGKGENLETADISDLISLGNYKGLKVTLQDTSVTDEDVQEYIKSGLEMMKTTEPVTDRAAEMGDTVNIDYEGKKDGIPFDGGTSKGRNLELGSHSFIDGFEDGLVGAEIGETRELNLTFPEDYHKAELAGQDVVFTVKVNSISANILPDLTDEVVKKLDPDVSSVKEYREKVKNDMKKSREDTAKSQAFSELLSMVQGNSDIKAADQLPDWLLDDIKSKQKQSFESSLQLYGIDLESYLKQQGMTEADFDETLTAYAQSIAGQQLTVQALANAENITVTEEDLTKQYEEDAAAYGYKSGEEFREAVKNMGEEQTFRDATLTRKVEEMLLSYADITNPEMLTK
ncbi:MAG: trigger factor [Lachnospiraceae bacterium]|nr:trigger factor [Lachnospiraceae bacterium]